MKTSDSSNALQVLPLAQGLSTFLRDDLFPATGLEGIPSPRYSGPQHSPESVGAPDSLSAPLVGSQQIQGLFTNPGTLAAGIDVLDSMYGQIYEAAELGAGEIDERIFIHGGEVGTSDGRVNNDDGMGPARSAPDSDGGGGMSAPFRWVLSRDSSASRYNHTSDTLCMHCWREQAICPFWPG